VPLPTQSTQESETPKKLMKKRQFVKFYDQYAPRIYRFVYLKVNSPQDSEDLTSEAFFKFWQNFANKNEKIDNPRALLYRITNNLVIDFYRKKSRTELISDPEDGVLAKIEDKTDLNRKISLDSDIKEVKKALNQLKGEYQNIIGEYQNIIIWHYLDDFSAKEIAQIMEKPEGNIRVLIHRALKALKQTLK
jgi:RNA polymerase sigma-70 factor (ECF subfamily)